MQKRFIFLYKFILLFSLSALLATLCQVLDAFSFSLAKQNLLIILFIFYFVGDLFLTAHMLGEPVWPPFTECINKILELSKKFVGGEYTPSPQAWFSRLVRHLSRYEKRCLASIRRDIQQNRITYLQPLDPSCKRWGKLFSLWNEKLHSSGVRWALFSDLYLNQEVDDLAKNRFITDLDLYAKAILLNLYVSVKYNQGEATLIIWVFTKMIPTDWPLCNSRCGKNPPCISSRSNNDEEYFLREYMKSLQQCATLPEFQRVNFCRHIVVTDSPHPKFRSEADLCASLTSHRYEYFRVLHRDSQGRQFGKSFKIVINNSYANCWPKLLSDAIFYGTQSGGAINWGWAVCTTYTSQHRAILLHIFDLNRSDGRDCLNQGLRDFYNAALGRGDPLRWFTDWVTDKREEIT
jgi:hypothetical protein